MICAIAITPPPEVASNPWFSALSGRIGKSQIETENAAERGGDK